MTCFPEIYLAKENSLNPFNFLLDHIIYIYIKKKSFGSYCTEFPKHLNIKRYEENTRKREGRAHELEEIIADKAQQILTNRFSVLTALADSVATKFTAQTEEIKEKFTCATN